MGIEKFDVFVIGTGRSGRDVAMACAGAGKRVAIADNREYGGVCANRGCDPKKVLVGLTEILQRSQQMLGNGITKLPEFSWQDLQKFKLNFTDAVPFVNERRLSEKGIVLYHQSPKFLDQQTLSVEGKTVVAEKVVIAAGQKPVPLYFEGSQHLLTSEDFLGMEKIPKTMAFIGAGYIGMELAHVAARCGVEVTIVHSHQRPLKNFDPDMVDGLVKASKALGIRFLFNARANKVEKLKKNYKVYADQDGKQKTVTAERVFNAAGRVPSIDELGLEKGKVTYTKKGVTVNAKLQNPSNKKVYACGDVSDSPGMPLTPLGPHEAQVVISQLLDKKDKGEVHYPPQPSTVFTLPNLAAVGLSEEEAKQTGQGIIVNKQDAAKWYSAKHLNAKVYAFKTIVGKDSGKILGAHLLGSDVGETINLFALAMAHGIKTKDLQHTLFAYPTWGNDIKSMV